MSEPYSFEQISQIESHIVPGTMKLSDNRLSMFYRRWLAQKAFSVFDFQNAPEGWNTEYLKWCLICYGVAAVIKTDRFGVIPQQCGISGYDVYYRPTRALVTNPLFDKVYDLRIGKECEIIKLSPDWRGIADIIGHFADLMALTTTSIITNLYNARLSYVFPAPNKAMAESFKLMYDKIAQGNPAIFVHKDLFNDAGEPVWMPFQQDLNRAYIIDKLQTAQAAYLNDFYTYIGIPNIQIEKGERLTENESGINDYATRCLVALWKRTMAECLDKVNTMFDLNVKVDYNEDLRKELSANVDDGNSDAGSISPIQAGLV